VSEAFYVPDGDRYIPTGLTRGPWSSNAQHAGPPAALVGRAVERIDPGSGLEVARFTFEVLRPIPLDPLTVEARVARPGRRVQFVEATLGSADGEIARASAWRILPAEESIPEANLESHPPFRSPEDAPALPMFDPGWGESYFSAIEWRQARGSFFEPGPSAAWMRMRCGLVEGEDTSPLSRVLVAADSGNGISSELPIDRYLFVNTELTVHLVRMPMGDWVCLDAVSRIDPRGVGLAQSVLWDARGRIGAGNQALLVSPR
jgi:Acyl-CoA thioesterase C-terminal domain/Acyl-CoA thioesterase N-terminal domain